MVGSVCLDVEMGKQAGGWAGEQLWLWSVEFCSVASVWNRVCILMVSEQPKAVICYSYLDLCTLNLCEGRKIILEIYIYIFVHFYHRILNIVND